MNHEANGKFTQLSSQKLAPVMKALTTSGGGRLAIVRNAYEEGVFQDVRLLPLAIGALHDSSPGMGQYAEDHIIPSYGKSVVPHLIAALPSDATKRDCRCIRLIGRLGGDEVEPVLLQYADSDVAVVRIAAIQAMAGRERLAERLIGWIREEKKAIRIAAYTALAECRSEVAIDRVIAGIGGRDGYELHRELARIANSELHKAIARKLGDTLRAARDMSDDAPKLNELQEVCHRYMFILEGKQVEELYAVYSDALEHSAFYEAHNGGYWLKQISQYASHYLEQTGTMKALELLLSIPRHYPFGTAGAFRAAFKLLSPQELYEHFAVQSMREWAALGEKRRHELLESLNSGIEEVLQAQVRQYEIAYWHRTNGGIDPRPKLRVAFQDMWDERWLHWAIQHDRVMLTVCLARPENAECEAYLKQKLLGREKTSSRDDQLLMELLLGAERAGIGEEVRWEGIVTFLEKNGDELQRDTDMIDSELAEAYISQLPARYLGRLEAVKLKCGRVAAGQLDEAMKAIAGVVTNN